MFRLVVYHVASRKVILDLPLEFDQTTQIASHDTICHEDFDFGIYCDMDPVFYEDVDGDICLKPNTFLVNSNILK